MDIKPPPSQLEPAGFWIRSLAYLIDSIVLSVVVFAICTAFGFPTFIDFLNVPPGGELPAGSIQAMAVGALVGIIFFAVLEASKWQATIGKKVLGLQVIDMEHERINFIRALARFVIKALIIILFVPAMIVIVLNDRKRGLHDFISGTRVYVYN